MELSYANANKLLCQEFAEMQAIYDSDTEDWYNDGDNNTSYLFYGHEFQPFILRHLKANDRPMLEKIFAFLERLMTCDDYHLINMVGVQICEALYFDNACEDYRGILFEHCGQVTLRSFYDCLPDEDKAAWDGALKPPPSFYERCPGEGTKGWRESEEALAHAHAAYIARQGGAV